MALLLFLAIDIAVVGRPDEWVIIARLLWAGVAFFHAWQVLRGSEREIASSLALSGATTLAFTVIIWRTGGFQSPYFAYYLPLPLVFALVGHEHRASVLLLGLGLFGSASSFAFAEDSPLIATAWSAMSLTTGGLALYGAHMFAMLLDAEREQSRARLGAVEQLAVSERLRSEAERFAVAGRLAAGVAHEINNPLAYVTSNLNLLRSAADRQEALDPEELRELHAETAEGLTRIRQIVADLKSFARDDEDSVEACALPCLVHEAVRLASVRLRKAGEVLVDPLEGLPAAMVNGRRLVQVLVNLLVNAADAVEDGARGNGQVRVRATHDAGFVCLLIEDDGPGIAEPLLPRIFEPFFTTKPVGRGTGLGLALSREYVERFGGTLVAENRAEGGARFIVRMRADAESAVPAAAA